MKRTEQRTDRSAKNKLNFLIKYIWDIFTLASNLEKPWNFRDVLYIAAPQ